MARNFISLKEVLKKLNDLENSLEELHVPEDCNDDNEFIADPQDAQNIVEENEGLEEESAIIQKKSWCTVPTQLSIRLITP